MELLELLAHQKNCTYISDLQLLPKGERSFPQLKTVTLTTYSEQEWKEAVWYILHRRCRNGEQAKQLLMG